jgi:HK97 family phage portal protein
MAWNTGSNKALNNISSKGIGPGAPVAQDQSFVGRPYKDSWDIERAYREGMQRVTWVARCIDVIAGNQARLPIILRKDNSPDGEIIVGKKAEDSTLLQVLNTKSNVGENSFIFRYRLSSQLLLGTRGAFIEKVRGRDGDIIGLNLLPPQATSPIPDPKKFVSGYEVMMPNGEPIILKPEDVVWVRRPHPLDPYLSLTPMESAGIAIEIENFAKLYNRNFLMNDGRPGSLLVVKGEIDDDDKEELKSRFRGNLATTGRTTVLSADDGVDFVDVSASPRDAAYIQMRQITKEEILAAFGVPETVIGNAAGRTFSNASEEIRVFWTETMLPHLEPLARALDELDEVNYIDFDTSLVPVLMLYKQERERYLKDELSQGLISVNEYRLMSGRKEVDADLADSLLMNPNLTPIANTKKKMEEPPMMAGAAPGAPGAPGMPPGPEGAMPPGAPPIEGAPPSGLDPNTMAGALAAATSGAGAPPGEMSPPVGAPETAMAPQPEGMASANSVMHYKSEEPSRTMDRWVEILDRSLERVLERQQRVVMEKANGVKSRKALFAGTLEAESILSPDVWNRQLEEDIKPVLSAIVKDAIEVKQPGVTWNELEINVKVYRHIENIKQLNSDMFGQVKNAIINAISTPGEDARHESLKKDIIEMYANLHGKIRHEVAFEETNEAWNSVY